MRFPLFLALLLVPGGLSAQTYPGPAVSLSTGPAIDFGNSGVHVELRGRLPLEHGWSVEPMALWLNQPDDTAVVYCVAAPCPQPFVEGDDAFALGAAAVRNVAAERLPTLAGLPIRRAYTGAFAQVAARRFSRSGARIGLLTGAAVALGPRLGWRCRPRCRPRRISLPSTRGSPSRPC